jgi:uncharacterized protein YbaA (DUF1428 family)
VLWIEIAPGVTERIAYLVVLHDSVEKLLGDESRADRIAGQEHHRCDVAWPRLEVDGHARTLLGLPLAIPSLPIARARRPLYCVGMSYIDGFVVPVTTSRKQQYVEMAGKHATLLREYGATRVVEAWGDDVPVGKVTDFRRAVAAEDTETIVFSWCEWPSKEIRDAAQKRMHEDPRMKELEGEGEPPFSPKRIIFGGFVPVLEK